MANVLAGALLAFSFAMLEVSDSLILTQRQQDYPITKAITNSIKLLGDVLEEIVTNTINYGYDDARKHEIIVRLEVTENSLNIEICDDGREFNPFNEPEPNVSLRSHEPQVGGLGIHFVRKMLDICAYDRREGRNIVNSVRSFEERQDLRRFQCAALQTQNEQTFELSPSRAPLRLCNHTLLGGFFRYPAGFRNFIPKHAHPLFLVNDRFFDKARPWSRGGWARRASH